MSKCRHCGCDSDPVKGKPRSVEQLKRFFAVLHSMYHHWPDTCEFQPHNEEHLRAWVLCAAGYGEIMRTTQIPDIPDEGLREIVRNVVTQAYTSSKTFPRWKGNTCVEYAPKSIAFNNMGQAKFNALNDAVEEIYRAETGLDPDQVLKESEKAA